jgi:hypothetical protein
MKMTYFTDVCQRFIDQIPGEMQVTASVRGKGHLHTCIAGRKDKLRRALLRKDNPIKH